MKKFIYIHNLLLIEATAKEIYDKYYNDIDYNQFFKIVVSDPKTKTQNNEIVKIGPYSKILLNIYRKGNLKIEDLPKATEYLGYVYKYNISLDIKYIDDLSDIYNLVSKYIVKEKFSVENVMKSLPKDDYEILLNSKNWYIISPQTQKAACYFGFGTQWCTTWGPMSLDPKLRDRTSHYNRYKYGLYILINKNNEDDRYQFHFDSKQFKNPGDKDINAIELLNQNTDLKYYFFPSLYRKNLDQNTINQQLEKIDILDKKDLPTFSNNIYGEIDNPIVKALLQNDIEAFLLTTNDKIKAVIEDNLDIDSSIISIPLTKSLNKYIISDVQNLLSNLERSSYYVDCPDTEVHESTAEHFLEKYYEENKNSIDTIFKINSVDECKELFLDELIKYGEFVNFYTSAECVNYENAYEAYCKSESERIKKYIDFNNISDYIEINKFYFINFIIKFEISKIDDLYDIISNYIEDNDINVELDWDVWEFQEPVSYNDVKSSIEDFFDFMGESTNYRSDDENEDEDEDEDEDEENNKICFEVKRKLLDIKNKIFKNNDEIDNEIVNIKLDSDSLNCKKGTVFIELTNKQTNKTEKGWVRIDNLPSYVQNYKLFENIIRFKKLI